MPKKTIEQLNADIQHAIEQRKHFMEQEKILRKQAAELTVKNRAKRIREHGELLEQFLEEPEALDKGQVEELLTLAFSHADVRAKLDSWFADIRALKAAMKG